MDVATALRRALTGIHDLKITVATQGKQIQTLAADLAAVNAKTQRFTTTIGPLSIGATDVTVTWPNGWPDVGYSVTVNLISGTAALGNLHATLKSGTKTTTDCVVTVSASAAVASVGVDVIGVRT